MDTILDAMDLHGATPYIVASPDLTKTSPLVVDMPAGMFAGMIDDFWERPITDIGLVLIAPPQLNPRVIRDGTR